MYSPSSREPLALSATRGLTLTQPLPIAAGAPRPEECRAVSVAGENDLAWCLATAGATCRFARPLSVGLLCGHPACGRIIARTLLERHQHRQPAGLS
jgi:hypothetical protein